jgi:hypothetical protein
VAEAVTVAETLTRGRGRGGGRGDGEYGLQVGNRPALEGGCSLTCTGLRSGRSVRSQILRWRGVEDVPE